ncbi:hypothetical protein BP6252_00429 [Coleophoma cylindrospora]|uniref:Major facilitator superfamily (MFS) profile domain-containing protein n=1 Tax=Coleophoma cylindrospora TaxID=1849047 RepID=A0A3D8SQ24_9HELO|nr:hypothetical protein BP6252_00429 [Coleophoma cylindrospora]
METEMEIELAAMNGEGRAARRNSTLLAMHDLFPPANVVRSGFLNSPFPVARDGSPIPLMPGIIVPSANSEEDPAPRSDVQDLEAGATGGGVPKKRLRKVMVLIMATIVEALLWGFVFSFGLFQNQYAAEGVFVAREVEISMIFIAAVGFMYGSGAVFEVLFTRFPVVLKVCSRCGLPVAAIGLFLASRSTEAWQFILTQGLFYGIGAAMQYYSAYSHISDWYSDNKGFAFGMMLAGSGIGGVVIPLIIGPILKNQGSTKALSVWAIVLILPTPVNWFYLKPRNWNSAPASPQPLDWSFLKSKVFWVYQGANIIQSAGYFLPGIYVATFAQALGLSAWEGISLTAILNICGSFSSLAIGKLSDIRDVPNIVIASMAAQSVSVLLVWGLADNMAHLSVFVIIYGLVAGGFTSIYSGMAREIRRDCPNMSDTWMMGILSSGRGIGPILCSITTLTLFSSNPEDTIKEGYGSPYEGFVLFSGTMALLGVAVVSLAKWKRWI